MDFYGAYDLGLIALFIVEIAVLWLVLRVRN